MSAPATGYKFGQKNQWRRTIWNRIVERLPVHPSEAVVLYLPGPDNLDRVEAERRGFRPNNLIGVDKNQAIVDGLRESGQLAICGDFLRIATAWNCERRVHVVFGDFCSGLERKIFLRMYPWVIGNPAFSKSVFAFNFQRGRDPSTNDIRAEFVKLVSQAVPEHMLKHRGLCFLYTLSGCVTTCNGKHHSGNTDWDVLAGRVNYWHDNACPAFLNYRSTGGNDFDSVVFTNPTSCDVGVWKKAQDDLTFRSLLAERRRIAATMAHRTMRAA